MRARGTFKKVSGMEPARSRALSGRRAVSAPRRRSREEARARAGRRLHRGARVARASRNRHRERGGARRCERSRGGRCETWTRGWSACGVDSEECAGVRRTRGTARGPDPTHQKVLKKNTPTLTRGGRGATDDARRSKAKTRDALVHSTSKIRITSASPHHTSPTRTVPLAFARPVVGSLGFGDHHPGARRRRERRARRKRARHRPGPFFFSRRQSPRPRRQPSRVRFRV